MVASKTMIAGLTLVGAAAAGVVLLSGLPLVETEPPTLEEGEAAFALCLKNDMPFFEGASAKCYSRTELMALSDAPVLNLSREPVSVAMTHPTDMAAAQTICRTCGVWLELKGEGWFALTSRDQRREAFFIQACGALSLLLKARPAGINHFTDDTLQPDEVMDFLRDRPFGIVATPKLPPRANMAMTGDEIDGREGREDGETPQLTPPAAPIVTKDGAWRLSVNGRKVVIQELAVADFDSDGVAELLVFTRAGPEDGTAISYAVGLLEKDTSGAALSFTPTDFVS